MKERRDDNFRFFVRVFAGVVIIIILGIFFIKNLFDEGKTLKKIDVSGALGKSGGLANPPIAPNQIKIFFTTDGRTLTPEIREVKGNPVPVSERAKFIINELIKGPTVGYFEPTLPKGLIVRGIYLVKDELIVDFSAEAIDHFGGGFSPEILFVYSIVNSIILNCDEVKSVRILVEGNRRDVMLNYVDVSSPLYENVALSAW